MQRGQVSVQQPPLTPVVKKLLIINAAVWVGLQLILSNILPLNLVSNFGLTPIKVITEFQVWQLFTYMFLHSTDVFHIAFNMLLLWFIGSELELRWGSRYFLTYYLFCGVGAGLIYILGYGLMFMFGLRLEYAFIPVVGASGAIFGLLLAYGVLFGERIMYFLLIFPMKAKVFVMIIGAVELLMIIRGGQQGVANLAHIGGLISGILFLLFSARRSMNFKAKSRSKNRPKLHLVIDNDQPDDDSKKYWN